MGYLPPTTIASTLAQIQAGELILPAIQREYVWEADQVVTLFDSVMRGYPVGGFLSWKVEPHTIEQFRFYGFMRDYSRFDNLHCPSLDVPPTRTVTAMLDGQQRLTSLNIGLRGSFAERVRGGWRTNKAAYPPRRLYLNVLGDAPENESGLLYDLRLIRDDQIAAERQDPTRYWFPVPDIYAARSAADLLKVLAKHGVGNDEGAADRIGTSVGRRPRAVEPALLLRDRPRRRTRPRHLYQGELRWHGAFLQRPAAVHRHRAVEGA